MGRRKLVEYCKPGDRPPLVVVVRDLDGGLLETKEFRSFREAANYALDAVKEGKERHAVVLGTSRKGKLHEVYAAMDGAPRWMTYEWVEEEKDA